MALALNGLRSGTFNLPNILQRAAATSALLRRPTLPSWTPLRLALPLWNSILEFFPSIVLAVPKKKVSHSRKAMRSANKGLKDKLNIVNCPGCGSAKLAHNICPTCYSEISRGYKRAARESAGVGQSRGFEL